MSNDADLVERFQWKKVEAPKNWTPKEPGEELCGFYGGKTVRNGKYGQYEVVLVHVPARGTVMLSGVKIVQLADAARVEVGWPVRIVWQGYLPLPTPEGEKKPRQMKLFELFVAEGDPVSPEYLPRMKEQKHAGPQ